MMTQLTTADRFEIVDAQYYNKVRSEYRDKTADVEIDRWNNYGKDRLYINNLKTGDGWISLKDDDFGGSRWTSSKADWGLDGDELTIKIGSGPTWTYVITVKVHGDDFEAVTTEPRDIDFDDLEECVSETTEIRFNLTRVRLKRHAGFLGRLQVLRFNLTRVRLKPGDKDPIRLDNNMLQPHESSSETLAQID